MDAMRMVLPEPSEHVDLAALYRDVSRPRPLGRPWVIGSMISSIDGATAVDGRSRPLANADDKAIFALVRDAADVILVGASTVRAERYRPPRLARQRIAVVTRSGDLPYDSELFHSGQAVVITTTDAVVAGDVPVIRAGTPDVDIGAALNAMSNRADVDMDAHLDNAIVTCEGGPTLMGAVIEAGLLDEWCWTISPRVAGGQSKRLARSDREVVTDMELAHLCVGDGYVFTRYVRR
jgi:riboflavin biosynthesis pyrimidine reductase